MSELDDYLAAYRADWIKVGQPSPTVTIAMVQEIERLRVALDRIAERHGFHTGRQAGQAMSDETIAEIDEWLWTRMATP